MGADTLAPEVVFTPTKPPEREMFTRRNEPDAHGNPGLQDLVRETLREPGKQLLLYGDAGVGKTSLLQYAAEDEEMKPLRVPCMTARSFAGHVEAALHELVKLREVGMTKGSSRGRSAEGGLSKLFIFKGTISRQEDESHQFESTSRDPIQELAAAMHQSGLQLLVFDNFQNVEKSEVKSFAQAAEVLSDISAETGDVKLVIIGVAEDAHQLIGDSPSLQRRITEIEVPRMPDLEIDELLENGFSLLKLPLRGDAKARLIYLSDGFPYFAHTLGLNIARNPRGNAGTEVDRDDVDAALERTVKGVEASFDERIRQAIESKGEKQPRRRVLQLLATSADRDWTASKVIAEVTTSTG
jgi:hypothetical protein